MPHQCPFPVRSTDSRYSYRTGSVPGFTLSLALVAILAGYAGFSGAAPVAQTNAKASGAATEMPVSSGAVVGYAKGRLPVCPTRNSLEHSQGGQRLA